MRLEMAVVHRCPGGELSSTCLECRAQAYDEDEFSVGGTGEGQCP